jgi:hypothetical protein
VIYSSTGSLSLTRVVLAEQLAVFNVGFFYEPGPLPFGQDKHSIALVLVLAVRHLTLATSAEVVLEIFVQCEAGLLPEPSLLLLDGLTGVHEGFVVRPEILLPGVRRILTALGLYSPTPFRRLSFCP